MDASSGGLITSHDWTSGGMREIGQGSVPSSEPEGVTFASLRMAESSERVDITLDERMLSMQGRRQTSVDIRLTAIHTVKHHSTQLVPNWLLILGLACIWIGYRLMVPPMYRLTFIGLGLGCIAARFGTHQPTLTVQTTSGDTHVVYGNERALNHISFMFHHLANGKSMGEVKALVEALEAGQRALEHNGDVQPAPVLPDVLHAPRALDHFLAANGVEVDAPPTEEIPHTPEWTPTDEPEPVAANPFTGFLPSYIVAQGGSPATGYPETHRPAPVNVPVLLPFSTPPMHQTGTNEVGSTGFLPSFIGPEGAHIPHRTTAEVEVAADEPLLDDVQLDAALLDMEDEVLEAEPVAQSPHRPTEHLLHPKAPRTIEDSVFQPRKSRTLKPRSERRSTLRTVRERSQEVLEGLITRTGPSPYATSETSGAMREHAENGQPPNANVMTSLSQDEGGSLPREAVDRLVERGSTLLSVAQELGEERPGDLDSMSFGDLQPSKAADEATDIPRLDD